MKSLELFILTNGASSYEYTMQSLEAQTYKCKMTTISGMRIDDAMNACHAKCESDYYMVVNDDMYLHPKAVQFYHGFIQRFGRRMGLFACMLWEPWPRHMLVQCLKVFNRGIARQIGFSCDRRGKVDRVFLSGLRRFRFPVHIDEKSVVAMHLMRSRRDQVKYRELWVKNSKVSSVERLALLDKDQSEIYETVPYEDQVQEVSKLDDMNKRNKSIFWKEVLR